MKDERVWRYAVQAFGMQELDYASAFIRKLLSDGIDRPDSLANRLTDPRFRAFVQTFDFSRYGAATTSFTRAGQGTVDRYLRQSLETQVGRDNEGVRLALYFQRKAPEISTPYALMADRALWKVTQVALGLPPSVGAGVDRQAELIGNKLDIADLKRPDKLAAFLTRFAAKWDIAQPATEMSTGLGAMTGGGAGAIGADLLARWQTLQKAR